MNIEPKYTKTQSDVEAVRTLQLSEATRLCHTALHVRLPAQLPARASLFRSHGTRRGRRHGGTRKACFWNRRESICTIVHNANQRFEHPRQVPLTLELSDMKLTDAVIVQ